MNVNRSSWSSSGKRHTGTLSLRLMRNYSKSLWRKRAPLEQAMRISPQNFLRMIADMGFLILNLPLRTTARKAKSSSFHGKPFTLEDKSCWEAKVGEACLCFHPSTSRINVYELGTINDVPLL